MPRTEKAMWVIGSLLLIMGLAFNEWLFAQVTPDKRIDNTLVLHAIRGFNLVIVTLGILIIAFRKTPVVQQAVWMGLMFTIMFLAVDWMIYWASPWLPPHLIVSLSPQAQIRYFNAHQDDIEWVYFDYVRRGQPDSTVSGFPTDSLGYRNPANLLQQPSGMDVLLIGDSFTWGTEALTIADYMRESLAPKQIYSLGIPGDGIPQWRYHYLDFVKAFPSLPAPKLVILNFYSGNDVSDTHWFFSVEAAQPENLAVTYFTYYTYRGLLPKATTGMSMPKLPEFLFLLNSSFQGLKPSNVTPPQEKQTGLFTQPITVDREPYPVEFTPEILVQIQHTIETIHTIHPNTQIVLSYIPTSAAIYGSLIPECPTCEEDLQRQKINSQILDTYAKTLGIHYVDVTPALQAAGQTILLWSLSSHFSPEGYRLYSHFLTEHIKPWLSQ